MHKHIYTAVVLILISVMAKAQQDYNNKAFFHEQRIVGAGDYESFWRIPALLSLKNGVLLMACDKRKNNEADLPEDIDVTLRISPLDNGLCWSAPIVLAKGQGYGHGYGDPALVQCDNGDVICTFAGGNGFWNSSDENPISTYVLRSSNSGTSWSEPLNITKAIWGKDSKNPDGVNYKGSFNASGNGLCLTKGKHKGRIMFVAALCRKNEWVADNYVVYSDDNGMNWQVSSQAYKGGDEAKVIELSDGRLLMSVRQHGPRGYAISNDGGENWHSQGLWYEMKTNACNGDMLQVNIPGIGEVLLHSLPNSMERENVSLFVSFDEGKSWPAVVPIFKGASAYSTMTLLHDGTIGMVIERTDSGHFELWFVNFSIEWLRQQLVR